MVWILFLLLPIGDDPEWVARVELNTTYDPATGGVRFSQFIYWGRDGRVKEWHMVDRTVFWYVEKDHITIIRRTGTGLRWVKSLKWKRTHTYHDPEQEDARWLPIQLRKPLLK